MSDHPKTEQFPTTCQKAEPTTPAQPVLRVLSLDAGDPSLVLLLMAGDGEILPFDVAFFADLTQRPTALYRAMARTQKAAIKAGVPVLRLEVTTTPAQAVQAKVRELLGYPTDQSVPPGVVAEITYGLCLDEAGLATTPDVPYIKHAYPLIDVAWTRRICTAFLATHSSTANRRVWWKWGLDR